MSDLPTPRDSETIDTESLDDYPDAYVEANYKARLALERCRKITEMVHRNDNVIVFTLKRVSVDYAGAGLGGPLHSDADGLLGYLRSLGFEVIGWHQQIDDESIPDEEPIDPDPADVDSKLDREQADLQKIRAKWVRQLTSLHLLVELRDPDL